MPISEFTGPLVRIGQWSMLFSLGVTCLVIPLVILASRQISRPLNQLVLEADAIRNFQLDDPVTVTSQIKEVRRLSHAIATSKTALNTFGRYVPKELVKQLINSGEVAEVGGQRRELTVMFSDIADFTTTAERMPPEALMTQMSFYLSELGRPIQNNGGTIDKYIGDAIMAFWNAPRPCEGHPLHACITALECAQISDALNERWAVSGEPAFKTTFGLHLGEAVVGNIGSSDRMDYTAIGATINLAARLQGLNKFYGTKILVSETVVEATSKNCLFRPIDLVVPKGATKPVELFELIAMQHGVFASTAPIGTRRQAKYCKNWLAAYQMYRTRNWSGAKKAFAALKASQPEDLPARIYHERSLRYDNEPPPKEWTGVEVFDMK